MPGFTVTRGFGGSVGPSAFIVQGFFPVVEETIRGAVRRGRRAKEQLRELLEDLKVTGALIAINGKDLFNPIINTISTSYRNEPSPEIQVTPVKLVVKQPEIKVSVKQVRN